MPDSRPSCRPGMPRRPGLPRPARRSVPPPTALAVRGGEMRSTSRGGAPGPPTGCVRSRGAAPDPPIRSAASPSARSPDQGESCGTSRPPPGRLPRERSGPRAVASYRLTPRFPRSGASFSMTHRSPDRFVRVSPHREPPFPVRHPDGCGHRTPLVGDRTSDGSVRGPAGRFRRSCLARPERPARSEEERDRPPELPPREGAPAAGARIARLGGALSAGERTIPRTAPYLHPGFHGHRPVSLRAGSTYRARISATYADAHP